MTANNRGLRRTRSALGRRLSTRRLTERAGQSPNASAPVNKPIVDTLEDRVLLGGDHPSFADFPTATNLNGLFNTDGEAAIAGVLGSSIDDDLFVFDVPDDGDVTTSEHFITVLADVANEGGSTLDSRVEIYDENAVLLFSGSTTTPDGASAITGVKVNDGWAGFVGAEGDRFFVRVVGENNTAGTYTLRVDAETSAITALPFTDGGESVTAGMNDRNVDDVVYRVATSASAQFDSLLTAHLVTDDRTQFDPRLEVFDSTGALITATSAGSTGSNAFVTLRGAPLTTFYFRARSDSQAPSGPSAGGFSLAIDADAVELNVDPVTRVQEVDGVIGLNADGMANGTQQAVQTEMYSFVQQRSGLTELRVPTLAGNVMDRVLDPAVSLFDSTGTLVAFNEDFTPDGTARLTLSLVGGETYFIVIDGFRGPANPMPMQNRLHRVEIETGIVLQNSPQVDDHADGPQGEPGGANAQEIAAGVEFENATQLAWSEPFTPQDYRGLFFTGLGDTSEKVLATQIGRINAPRIDVPNIDDDGMPVLDDDDNPTFVTVPDSDLFVFVPPVDMLGQFGGFGGVNDAGTPLDASDDFFIWEQRPSSRLQIMVERAFDDTTFEQTLFGEPGANDIQPVVRIYDSRGRLIEDATYGPGTTVISQDGTVAFVNDPNTTTIWDPQQLDVGGGEEDPGNLDGALIGLDVWGGQPYYIEITSATPGRYSLAVTADAYPDPTDNANTPGAPFTTPANDNELLDGNNGPFPAPYSFISDAADAGEFLLAESSFELRLDSFTGDGGYTPILDGRYSSATDALQVPGTSAGYQQAIIYEDATRVITPDEFTTFEANMAYGFDGDAAFAPNAGDVAVMREGGLLGIEHPLDTDLFFFRAPASGPIELRVQTQNLFDQYVERIIRTTGAGVMGEFEVANTVTNLVFSEAENPQANYDSFLDSALRVFNSDLAEIAYNDDSGVTTGEIQVDEFGTLGNVTFSDRDARIVFNAVAGNTYYVQVESALADQYLANQANPTLPVSWVNLIGSYDLLVNALPSSTTDPTPDDHVDFTDPTEEEVEFASPLALDASGQGGTTGRITSFVGFPADSDGFFFYANATGNISVTTTRTSGDMTPVLTLYDINRSQLGVPAVGNVAGIATANVNATQGQLFYAEVSATNGTGTYTISLDGEPVVDDHANVEDFNAATGLSLADFGGTASASGELERAGDTDVFSFEALDHQSITITVNSNDFSLDPAIDIYELAVDRRSLPAIGGSLVATPIRIASNLDIGGGNRDASVTVAVTPDRFSSVTTLEYSRYFVVVRGQNPESDLGDYSLDLTFEPVDDHPDVDQLELAVQSDINIAQNTGLGLGTGELERDGDTDVFQIVPPASGRLQIDVDAAPFTAFLPRIRVFDATETEIPVSMLGGMTDTGSGSVSAVLDLAVRDEPVIVVVQPSASAVVAASRTGTYTVSVTAAPIDDHANIGEFELATPIVVIPATGEGSLGTTDPDEPNNPVIDPAFESDLFSFETADNGEVTFTVTPVDNGGVIRASVTLFDANMAEIASETGAANGDVVTVTLATAPAGVYFALVTDADGVETGAYAINITSPMSTGGGGEGPEDDIDFNAPADVALTGRDGDGELEGSIDEAGDRDLFRFTAPASGRVFVQVVTPSGSLLDATVTVLDQANEDESSVVLFDSAGVPGATANGSFDGIGGTEYFIIVDGVGAGVGAYTVRIDASPETHFLYYPEGFTSSTINAFVSIANANDFNVDYSVIARYETGERDQIIRTGTINAGQRGGLDLNRGNAGSPVGLRPNTPFSIEIQSDGPLGATLAHYDFGATLGDAFTDDPSESWIFPRLERTSGTNLDFVLVYNPNPFDITVSLNAYDADGNAVTINRQVEAFRRGGYNLDTISQLPTGVFSATVTAEATNPADAPSFIGMVSSLSHFDTAETSGYASLGDASGGATAGALTSIENGSSVTSQLVLFNPGNSNATVTLRGEYLRVSLPDVVRVVELEPKQTLVLTGPSIGLAPNQPAGIQFTSSAPISLIGIENQFGDANSVDAATEATQIAFFGDAFIVPQFAADLYFETLNFYNPSSQPLDVEVELLFFNDPNPATITVSLDANGFGELILHEQQEILSRGGSVAFSIQVSASRPFVASLEHYDLFLLGGWQTLGAPIGLTNGIARVQA